MAWWIPAAISAASSLVGHFAGRGSRKKQKKASRQLSGLGDELRGFDPTQAAMDQGQAEWNMLQSPLSKAMDDYRANQVDTGRLRTGFSFEGQDRMLQDVYQNFTDQIASRSMQGAGMKLGALGMAGDVYSGLYDQGAREEQSKQNFWGGLGRDIGTAYLFRNPGG